MSFVSYAQNFEDVILWRALKDVTDGFYVDIGSQDPIIDSTSYGFSLKGWKGISIEPTDQYVELFKEKRPEDDIRQAFVSDQKTHVDFYIFPNTGLSTANKEVAEKHKAMGFECFDWSIDTITLSDVWEFAGDRDIHWLKIDVEGHEQKILEGWKDEIRPWVLVIESTLPLSGLNKLERVESHNNWEHLVLEKGYEFVYADGLNRFYLHKSHIELKPRFRFPPNVLEDNFITRKMQSADQRVQEMQEQVASTKEQLDLQEKLLEERKLLIDNLSKHLEKVQKALKVSMAGQTNLLNQKNELEGALLEKRKKIIELEEDNAIKNEILAEMARFESMIKLTHQQLVELENDKLKLRKECDELNNLIDEGQEHIRGLEGEIVLRLSAADEVQRQLSEVYNSWSWKLTHPLRKANAFFNPLTKRLLKLLTRIVGKLLVVLAKILGHRPDLREKVLKFLFRYPSISSRIVAYYQREIQLEMFSRQPGEQLETEEPYDENLTIEGYKEACFKRHEKYRRPRLANHKGLRIVLDLQALQTESANRGIGRYSLSLAKAMLRNGRKHEFFILLNGFFPESIERLKAEFQDLIPADHIVVWHNLPEHAYENTGLQQRAEISRELREHLIQMLEPDFIHISSLFESPLTTLSIKSFYDNVPTAVTFYDLIPYIHQEKYLGSPTTKEIYLGQIAELKKADLLLAISLSARQEGLDYLHFPEEKVISISSDASEVFRQVEMSEAEATAIKEKYGIQRKFLMTIGSHSIDLRKNVKRLIEAFASLPKKMQKEYQLVLVGQDPYINGEKIEKLVKNLRIAEGAIVLPGRVPDEDLVLLCNITDLFVFPSLHEGFGLPLLEAMRCGAPVIGSNNSSLPEVIGLEDAMFDAESVEDIAAKIKHALTHGQFRTDLIAHCAQQQLKFSWDNSAQLALENFEMIAEQWKASSLTGMVA